MTELYEDMMTSLENAYFQMRTAGLGYATHALEAQMEDFRERIAMEDGIGSIEKSDGRTLGSVEYTREDGLVDGENIIRLYAASSVEIEEAGGKTRITLHGAHDGNERYVVAIAEA